MRPRVAAVVVLCEPPPIWRETVESIRDQGDALIIVANGPAAIEAVSGTAAMKIINLSINLGTAAAYNRALEVCTQLGFDWLLILDQDSPAHEGLVDAYLAGGTTDTGVLWSSPAGAPNDIQKTLTYTSSGAMYRTAAVRAVGGWWDALFADGVDRELAIRLAHAGWRATLIRGKWFDHQLGSMTPVEAFGRVIHPTNHSPDRRRDMARAAAMIARRHWRSAPRQVVRQCWLVAGNTAAMLLGEGGRSSKLRALLAGAGEGLRRDPTSFRPLR